jgi:predicted kinase
LAAVIRRESYENLTFPADSLVVVTALPGSGKSTLLRRLYQLTGDETAPAAIGGVRVIDSAQSRNHWAHRLSLIPKPLRTLIVYFTHLSRITRMLSAGHPVIAHNRGAWPHVLHSFAWLARRHGAGFHLIMLDVDPRTALAGQRARGRLVAAATFERHCRRWRVLIDQVRRGNVHPASSVTILDRAAVDRLQEIRFLDSPSADHLVRRRHEPCTPAPGRD